MGSRGLKSDSMHPYMIEAQKRSEIPIEWKRVSKEWILKFGGKTAKKALK